LFEGITYHAAFTYADETQDALRMPLSGYDEVFPEPRERLHITTLSPASRGTIWSSILPPLQRQPGRTEWRRSTISAGTRSRIVRVVLVDDPALQYFSYQIPMRVNQITPTCCCNAPVAIDPNVTTR